MIKLFIHFGEGEGELSNKSIRMQSNTVRVSALHGV